MTDNHLREIAERAKAFAEDPPVLQGEDDKLAFFYRADVLSLLSRIRELEREVSSLNHHYRCHRENGERLHSQLRDMNAALEPFAKVGRAYADGNANAKHPLLILKGHERVGPVTVGDFLRASDQSLGEPSPEEVDPVEEQRF